MTIGVTRCSAALLALLVSVGSSRGQSLHQELAKEPPEKLVRQARENGDIVRGAILFHQGNIACAKCHQATADKVGLGPDLSRLGKDVTDASIVASILTPSAIVKEAFRTTVVLRHDGEILDGVMVDQDDDSIVLRNLQDVSRLTKIRREDIDQIRPGNQSLMPNDLVDQLKNRQQFLDLLRYVIDVKKRGPSEDVPSSASSTKESISDELHGFSLLRKLNCSACHQVGPSHANFLTHDAPDLRWSAKHLNPEYLTRFIADPDGTKPRTSMPRMSGHQDQRAVRDAATAIVNYLVSLDGNVFADEVTEPVNPSAAMAGDERFHTIGCVACHSPRDGTEQHERLGDSVPLLGLAEKYSVAALSEFLENPHVARSSGLMPNMQLTHREAVDLSHFLLQRSVGHDEQVVSTWRPNPSLIDQGKTLFASMRCTQCHTGIAGPDPPEAMSVAMNDVDIRMGCLSENPAGDEPRFDLTDTQRTQIQAALQQSDSELTNEQQINLTLSHFNCLACHRRDELGGVAADRINDFHTTNQNLGEQGRIPPTLTGVGAKLNAKWMRDVLVNRRSIRPYMKTRMPQYGEQNVGHLVDLFQSTDQLAEIEFAPVNDQVEMRKFGLVLAGNQGLNCVACHTYRYEISDTMPAVDLTEMSARLKKNWFYQYMLAPQTFSPITVMPSFWPNGQSIRPDLSGTAKHQVESLWQYLLDGRQARPPRGVLKEPLEIVVDDEARMLRRKYQGVGKRGIGVGYPGGVNIVFDAEQMRLATVWRGKFVDPSGAWYGQGHGSARPMEKTLSFAEGPDLDHRASPWAVDDGRPPKHRFRGYTLDDSRRPVFRYTLDQIEVEDFCAEFNDNRTNQVQLKRRVKITSTGPSQPLRFRLASAEEVSVLSDEEFAVGDRLRIKVASNHPIEVTDASGTTDVSIPLQLDAGGSQELIIEYRFE